MIEVMTSIKNKKINFIISVIVITAESTMVLECFFLLPNTVLDGRINGVSIILSKLFKMPISILAVMLNILFMYIGYKYLEKGFLFI